MAPDIFMFKYSVNTQTWLYLLRFVSGFFQENIISPMEDSPIPDISGKDANDCAGTSPRSQGKAFRYLCSECTRYQRHHVEFSTLDNVACWPPF